jgi:hypothetical protein
MCYHWTQFFLTAVLRSRDTRVTKFIIHTWFQASAKKQMRTVLYCVIIQRFLPTFRDNLRVQSSRAKNGHFQGPGMDWDCWYNTLIPFSYPQTFVSVISRTSWNVCRHLTDIPVLTPVHKEKWNNSFYSYLNFCIFVSSRRKSRSWQNEC